MTEENQDFPVWQDNDYRVYVTVTFDQFFATPLSSLKLLWGMAQKSDSTDIIIMKDNASLGGINVVGDDTFIIFLNREDTANLKRGKYYHEARSVDLSNNVSQLMTGHVTVKESLLNVEADTHIIMLSAATFVEI